MHLVYKALDKRAIPSSLPKELQKPPKIDNNNDFGAEFVANFPAEMVPIAAPIPVIPMRPIAPPSSKSSIHIYQHVSCFQSNILFIF